MGLLFSFVAKHTSEKQEMERTVDELQKNIDNEFHGMSSLFVLLSSWYWHLNFIYPIAARQHVKKQIGNNVLLQ